MTSYLLTPALAMQAIEMAMPSIMHAMESGIFKHKRLGIVVMDPGIMPWEVRDPREAILSQRHIGEPNMDIARQKAFLSWRYRMSGQVIQATMPHLLREHNTPYHGSVFYEGIAVGGSGIQSWFDESSAMAVAANCKALAIAQMQKQLERKDDFLRYGPGWVGEQT